MLPKPASDQLPPQSGVKHYFGVQKYCFALIGIDPTSLEKTIFNNCLAYVPMILLFLDCFPIFIYAGQYKNDLVLVTDACAPLWQTILSVLKCWVFMWNQKKIVGLIRMIWLQNVKAQNEELKIIVEENTKNVLYAKSFLCMVFTTCSMAMISPLVIGYFHYFKGDGFWEYLDPIFKGTYYVDIKAFPGYSFVFLWNFISLYCVLCTSVASDTLFAWYCHNISAQFRIVKYRFRETAKAALRYSEFDDAADADYTVASTSTSANDDPAADVPIYVFRSENEVVRSIISCIKYHRYVIDLADNLNDVYMLTVLVKFLISFLQIACLAFQLSRGSEVSQMMFHVCFMLAVSIQLMLYCHSAQQVMDESTSVSTTIYDCFGWHDLSIKSKRLLILPMMRSEKPCLVSGVFFFIDLPLFLQVYKTAGSIITMLRSMEK